MADNGPGIPANELDHIFEMFYTTKLEGHGVGLYVCRQLVRSWNGELYVFRDEGVTHFVLSVPRIVGSARQ